MSESVYSESSHKKNDKEYENENRNANVTDEIDKTEKSFPIISNNNSNCIVNKNITNKSLIIESKDDIRKSEKKQNYFNK